MNTTDYKTKEEVLKQAQIILNKSLREIIPKEDVVKVENDILNYKNRRKGLLGELIEWYVFGKKPDGKSEADFSIAGVELKTTPLKKSPKKQFVSKERLVFSMIDYDKIVHEKWESSSFLKKNKLVLLMFYLWIQSQSIIDHEFKFTYLLNLLEDISKEDIFQIQKDWEYIVAKISRGEAHLLSEGDTYYLGACTKAANSRVVRDQPRNRIPAKPRAFSLKQQYLNYLIQKEILGKKVDTKSIFKKQRRIETIEDAIKEIFSPYVGKTDTQIISSLGLSLNKRAKGYKRLLINKIIGIDGGKIEELEKANVTLKVITLEHTGTLRESISFPAFDYNDLITQVWYDDKEETMSDFHAQLETKKFLFVIFQKIKNSDEIILKKTMFWNFPMKDLPEAERVWQETIDCINEGKYKDLPKITGSSVAHVRPHGKNAEDTIKTPQGTMETKRCFWLNAKYIQQAIEN
ncbi:MAG TPA: Sau3AI family type II restriction endonuclease [Candidatus Paceibacterota bacterium]|nr:Sau3AI family type II restriction endonuclease [Candidatus Paceibacterota bacterium]